VANWGTHELQLRLPAKLLPFDTAQLYCLGDSASVREKSGNVIVTFLSNDEEWSEWVEGDGVLSSMLSIRDGLARGDLRSLYLGWLLCAQNGELSDEQLEPTVPPNLRELTGALDGLAEFLRIDTDLLAVAAEASLSTKTESFNRKELEDWVAALPPKEKDEILIRLVEGGDTHLGTELHLRFQNDRATSSTSVQPKRRTVGDLLHSAKVCSEKRRKEEARKAAAEKARKEREAALAREKHLEEVADRIPKIWTYVEDLIATKQAKNYDEAVAHIVDLRDVANRKGTHDDFAKRINAFRDQHGQRRALMDRLKRAGL